MDIAGAKALKERLGLDHAEDAPSVSPDVPVDAPPIYHWTGVSKPPSDGSRADTGDTPATDNTSLFSRLGLSFR